MIKREISVKRQKTNKKNQKYSGVERYDNWNKKFTRGIQMQIWAGKRVNPGKCEGKTMEIIKSKE